MERSIFSQSRSLPPSQPHRQSCDRYKLVKLLPHIKEEFHYRVENRLMVKKIIHPRRDKTIVNSLNNTSHKSFTKRKKQRGNHTSVDHRRKVPFSGCIKKQIRAQTCDFQSTTVICGTQDGGQFMIRELCQKKQCLSIIQERFQIANHTSQSRWLTNDSNYLRESSVGKIIKNFPLNSILSCKSTIKTTNNNGKMENYVTLPCEFQKNQNQKQQKIAIVNQYTRICRQNIKKLQKRTFHHHLHNKENIFECQKT